MLRETLVAIGGIPDPPLEELEELLELEDELEELLELEEELELEEPLELDEEPPELEVDEPPELELDEEPPELEDDELEELLELELDEVLPPELEVPGLTVCVAHRLVEEIIIARKMLANCFTVYSLFHVTKFETHFFKRVEFRDGTPHAQWYRKKVMFLSNESKTQRFVI